MRSVRRRRAGCRRPDVTGCWVMGETNSPSFIGSVYHRPSAGRFQSGSADVSTRWSSDRSSVDGGDRTRDARTAKRPRRRSRYIERFLSPLRRSGTHCQRQSRLCRLSTVLGALCRLSCLSGRSAVRVTGHNHSEKTVTPQRP